MSKEKTAMQQMVEFIELQNERIQALLPSETEEQKCAKIEELSKVGAFLSQAKALVMVEKEQRRNLYINGFHDGQSYPEMLIDDEVVQRYNEKYGNDETQL